MSASESLSAGGLRLQVGSVTESIEVKAEVTAVQSVSSERSALLDHEQVTGLNTAPKWNQETGQQTNLQFGEPMAARDRRVLQFGLKVNF